MADKRISQLAERVDIANNDVVAIVASGATVTNKATMSSIQAFMQGALDVGVISVGVTISETDGQPISVTGSPITINGNITINLPRATNSIRGVLDTEDFINFSNKQSAITLTTSGTSGAATLVDNTLNIPNYAQDLTGFVTLGTAQTITAQKTITTNGGSDTFIVNHTSGSGIGVNITKGGNGEGLRVAKTSGSGNAVTITGGLLSAEAATLTGPLNGTTAQFSGDISTSTRLASASGGQQILINANQGSSTNRIETTGSLPLALVSSQAITLAAGGVTPQLTISTAGAVTLTGALNGTSAVFTANGSIFGTNSTGGVGLKVQAGNGAGTLDLIGRDNGGIDDNFVAFKKFDGTTLQAAFYVRSNIFSIRDATNTDVLNIVAGNVGIGTDTPGATVKLDVVGDIRTSTGILFGADTAAANALDDYEEGTWTMGISFGGNAVGVGYFVNTGTYTKIGRQVTVNGLISLTSKGSSTGDALITGLPFANGSGFQNSSITALLGNTVTFANIMAGSIGSGDNAIKLREQTEAGVQTALTDANFANNSDITVSMTYFV